jgi:hypothetical protein
MMREHRVVAAVGEAWSIDREWKLTGEVFWQPEAGEQISLCLCCMLVSMLLQ